MHSLLDVNETCDVAVDAVGAVSNLAPDAHREGEVVSAAIECVFGQVEPLGCFRGGQKLVRRPIRFRRHHLRPQASLYFLERADERGELGGGERPGLEAGEEGGECGHG